MPGRNNETFRPSPSPILHMGALPGRDPRRAHALALVKVIRESKGNQRMALFMDHDDWKNAAIIAHVPFPDEDVQQLVIALLGG